MLTFELPPKMLGVSGLTPSRSPGVPTPRGEEEGAEPLSQQKKLHFTTERVPSK